MIAVFSKTFQKDYRRLPFTIQIKFKERLKVFVINQKDPSLHNHALRGEFISCRSVNITGDYRAIYRTNPKEPTSVIFIRIGTHSELYE